MFDDRYGKFAERDDHVAEELLALLSKLWLPRPSAEKPIKFMSSMVGLSSKKLEIGGVAPIESPAATVIEPSRRLGAVGVEPWLQEGGPADRERRVGRASAGERVGRLGERHELPVVVADVEDRDLLQLPRVREEVLRIFPRAFCGPGMPSRKASVGARSMARTPATGLCLRMPGPAAMNVACMLTLSREVDQVGQVAVLAEELRRGDELPRRLRVGLVRRPEDDDHVTAAVRMQRIGAVDVPQLLLLHHLEDDLLLPGEVRVVEVLERRDDLVPDRLVVGGRDLRRVPGSGIAAGEVDVDLRRPAGVALLGERVARRGRARIVGGLAAVAALLALLEAEVDQHLADVDRVPLRREAVVGGDEHGRRRSRPSARGPGRACCRPPGRPSGCSPRASPRGRRGRRRS